MIILYCHNRYQLYSGEDAAFDSAKSLLERDGHQVSVFSEASREISTYRAWEKISMASQFLYSPRSKRLLAALVTRERPSVALVQNVFPLLSPSVYYGLAQAGIPVIQMVFNYRFVCANGQFYTQGKVCERCLNGSTVNGIIRRCYRDSYLLSGLYSTALGVHRWLGTWRRCIRLFVVPDRFLRDKLVEGGLPAERMRVIANPFDVDHYSPSFECGGYALFVGRLSRAKGIFTLLDATDRSASVRLKIVGDGEGAEEIRRHPAVLGGKVELLGTVYGPQLEELLGQAAFVVVPSEWYDNLPMIVCQAFAAGKPVVASRINGIPEYVRHEENGLLFSPGDSKELATSMERLSLDRALHRRLAEQARQTAERCFRPQRWLSEMNAVLREASQPPSCLE